MKASIKPKGETATAQDVLARDFAQVPMAVLSRKGICGHAKLLYGVIVGLCRENGYCFASNEYLARKFDVYAPAVSKWVRQLLNARLIETVMVSRANGRERHIYLLKQDVPTGDHTRTHNIRTDNTQTDTIPVGNDASEATDHTQSDMTVIRKRTGRSHANECDGHTRTDTHNIYPQQKEEKKTNKEQGGASDALQVPSEPAALSPEADQQKPARLPPYLETLKQEERRKRKEVEAEQAKRRNQRPATELGQIAALIPKLPGPKPQGQPIPPQ